MQETVRVRRIVTLAPHLTELVYSAGAEKYLVGVSAYSDYPEEAAMLPVVSDGFRIDPEALLAVKPDLVLAWGGGGQASSLELLRELDIAYVEIATRRLADIAPAVRQIGALAGTVSTANTVAGEFETMINELGRDRDPVRVFYQISREPPLYTVSDAHFISDVIRLCGGKNVFADLPTTVATVSVEAVVLADPEVITGAIDSGTTAFWRGFESMQVATNGNVFGVPADVVARPSMRLGQGARAICEVLDKARARR